MKGESCELSDWPRQAAEAEQGWRQMWGPNKIENGQELLPLGLRRPCSSGEPCKGREGNEESRQLSLPAFTSPEATDCVWRYRIPALS